MTLDLRHIPPHQRHALINSAIARHVLKREVQGLDDSDGEFMMRLPDGQLDGRTFESWAAIPSYSESMDEVMPLLERFAVTTHNCIRAHTQMPYRVDVFAVLGDSAPAGYGFGPTFALAACCALLSAHGVTVQT